MPVFQNLEGFIENYLPKSFFSFWGNGKILNGSPFQKISNSQYDWSTAHYQSPGSFTDKVAFYPILTKGVYRVQVCGVGDSDKGTLRGLLNGLPQDGGTELGWIDWYRSSNQINLVQELSLTMSKGGRNTLTFDMVSKNNASSGYNFIGLWLHIFLQ